MHFTSNCDFSHNIGPSMGIYDESTNVPISLSLFEYMNDNKLGVSGMNRLNFYYSGNLGNEFTRALLSNISFDVENLLNPCPNMEDDIDKVFIKPSYIMKKDGSSRLDKYVLSYMGSGLASPFRNHLRKTFDIKSFKDNYEAFRMTSNVGITKHFKGDPRYGIVKDMGIDDFVYVNDYMNNIADVKSVNKVLDYLDNQDSDTSVYQFQFSINIPYMTTDNKVEFKSLTYRFYYEKGKRSSVRFTSDMNPKPTIH